MSDAPPGGTESFRPPISDAIDAACDRFEEAWRAGGTRPRIEEYLQQAAETERPLLLRELVLLELFYRSRAGEPARPEDYLARFPALNPRWLERKVRQEQAAGRAAEAPTKAPSGPAVALEPGAEFVPGYRLTRRLGRGGFGEVWKAVGPGGVPTAMKFLRLEEGGAAVEAQALEFMKYVSHPHLLTTFGIWHRDNLLILGMELAECTLQDRLREAVRQHAPGIPSAELLEYMREATKGIDFLNEPRHTIDGRPNQSIVHRDINPQNLLLVGGGVKVADFGLARVMERSVTASAGGMTPAYAAPEFFHKQVSKQSDQYCLAVSYCQLRSNRLPFEGHPLEVMAGHLTQPPDLTILPEAERDVVARALAKQPHDRWPSCRVFVQELADCHAPDSRRTAAAAATPAAVTNSIGMRLVCVPAGRFLMGSPETEPARHADEGPQHLVAISRPFHMGIFPVTQQEYEAVMGHNPAHFKPAAGGGPAHPVESVSWYDATEFCRRLSSRYEERDAGRVYYLPTEAEWEYACRAGTRTPFAFGPSLSSLLANFNGQDPYGDAPRGPFRQQTTPVGSFGANAFGLYDMHGNVWEWCADFYGESYYSQSPERDPLGPRSGDRRVLRGGNWNSSGGKNCRSARRGKDDPTATTHFDGFRVVMIPV
jgi:formylglycine-generating enzyme required for sulfatase activity